MGLSRVPPNTPGSFHWQAQTLGVDPYRYALTAAGQPGRVGRQARFYLATVNHQRMRQMAKQSQLAQAMGSPPSL